MKGDMVFGLIISMTIGLLVLALMGYAIYYGFGVVKQTESFSACEEPSAGAMAGSCIQAGSICPGVDGVNVGIGLSGCPSDRIKNALDDSDLAKEYSLCCVATTCSALADTYGDTRVPRKEGCFGEDCVGDSVLESECVGFSETCTAKGGCCCVLG